MVNVNLELKEIIGLAEIGAISKDKLTELLEKFDKDDFIIYLVKNTIEAPEETPEEDRF